MPVLINECTDYQIEAENNLKLFPRRKPFSKKSDSSTDNILDEAKIQWGLNFLTEEDLRNMDILNFKSKSNLLNNLKAIKPSKTGIAKLGNRSSDKGKNTEVLISDKTFKSMNILRMEKESRQNFKKPEKPVEKEVQVIVDASATKKINKVAPLHLEKYEEKKMTADKRFKDTIQKLPSTYYQICQEDMKKKSFSQNNGRKYGLMNEIVGSIKNRGSNSHLNGKNEASNGISKGTENHRKMVEQIPSLPLDREKGKQKKVQKQVDEKFTTKKVINTKTGKIIEIKMPVNVADNKEKACRCTDTGLSKLRGGKRKSEIEPVVEESEPVVKEPDPIVEQPDIQENKKGTRIKPFSFEAREQELLKKKKILAKMVQKLEGQNPVLPDGIVENPYTSSKLSREESVHQKKLKKLRVMREKTFMNEGRKYEFKKWARSPEILRKKPFSVKPPKRYIHTDLFKTKLKTEERFEKRPKFDVIVEQKQKSLREQQLLKQMAEIKEFRKSLVHSPSPIPDDVMRVIEAAKKTKSDVSEVDQVVKSQLPLSLFQVSESDGDLFSDVEYTHTNVDNPNTESPIMFNGNENRMSSPDEQRNIVATTGDSAKVSNVEAQDKCPSNDESNDKEGEMLNSKENEAAKHTETEDMANKSDDTPSSTKLTKKLTPFNILMSAFKKNYST